MCISFYSSFKAISVSLVLGIVVLILNAVAYTTSQWSFSKDYAGDCETYIFVGIIKYKYGQSGCIVPDDYTVEKIESCDDIGLTNGDCDTFESAVWTGQAALAFAIMLVVYKLICMGVSHSGNHSSILWLFMVVCLAGEIAFAAFSFSCCVKFNDILDELPSIDGDNALGYGWTLELISGIVGVICALISMGIIFKG